MSHTDSEPKSKTDVYHDRNLLAVAFVSFYAIAEREVDPTETGGSPAHTRDLVLGVVRNGVLHRVDDSEVEQIEVGDRLLYVRKGGQD